MARAALSLVVVDIGLVLSGWDGAPMNLQKVAPFLPQYLRPEGFEERARIMTVETKKETHNDDSSMS